MWVLTHIQRERAAAGGEARGPEQLRGKTRERYGFIMGKKRSILKSLERKIWRWSITSV
jgi:hypothetical protein